MKARALLVLGVPLLLSQGCNQKPQPVVDTSLKSEPIHVDDEQSEVLRVAEKEWGRIWIPEGDSWFTQAKDLPYLLEIKGRRSEARTRPLSEADRLNGVQWMGTVEFYSSAERKFGLESHSGLSGTFQSGWNEWYTRDGSVCSYDVKKQDNEWKATCEVQPMQVGPGFRGEAIRPTVQLPTEQEASRQAPSSEAISIEGRYVCCEGGTCFYLTVEKDGGIGYRCDPGRGPMSSYDGSSSRNGDIISTMSGGRYTIQSNGDLLQTYNGPYNWGEGEGAVRRPFRKAKP